MNFRLKAVLEINKLETLKDLRHMKAVINQLIFGSISELSLQLQ